MATIDLASMDVLRETCRRLESEKRATPECQNWIEELGAFIKGIAAANEDERSSAEFHEKLWDRNPVSSPGQGNIAVGSAIADQSFRHWVARESLIELPSDPIERRGALIGFRNGLIEKLKVLQPGKTPPISKYFACWPLSFPKASQRLHTKASCDSSTIAWVVPQLRMLSRHIFLSERESTRR